MLGPSLESGGSNALDHPQKQVSKVTVGFETTLLQNLENSVSGLGWRDFKVVEADKAGAAPSSEADSGQKIKYLRSIMTLFINMWLPMRNKKEINKEIIEWL